MGKVTYSFDAVVAVHNQDLSLEILVGGPPYYIGRDITCGVLIMCREEGIGLPYFTVSIYLTKPGGARMLLGSAYTDANGYLNYTFTGALFDVVGTYTIEFVSPDQTYNAILHLGC